MTIDEMIERCPDIVKITPEAMIEVSNTKLNLPLDINKTWVDNGYDDLDVVEMIMELEKMLDISITDDVAESFTQGGNKPPIFKSYLRDKKIEQLGL